MLLFALALELVPMAIAFALAALEYAPAARVSSARA